MTLNYLIIGKNIRAARMMKNISQAELAEMVDLSTGYMSFIENGTRGLKLETFVNLANTLEVSADFLFAENLVFMRSNVAPDELLELLDGCNAYERRVILDVAKETKRILRENRYLKPKTPAP